ncbi:MAG: GTPase ObgE [Lentisphaerota bacterium]
MKGLTFVDRVTIKVFAGHGGDGCSSFRREKYIPLGGPDGGDGGRGGHVILRASKDESSLLHLYYQPLQRATHGGRGANQQKYGRTGEDHFVKVPLGTEIRDNETGESLGELLNDSDELIVAKGGKGGLGNMHFATSTYQAPTECTEGVRGEEKSLLLEMKSVADVGLVGYPNAGKSTLIGALTPAHPKVGAYPFTTLYPSIGTLELENYQRIKLADIPGLIDGAHQGTGLGHDFLRHIERTSFLLYVIDMAGTEGRNPVDDFRNLRKELKLYKAELAKRPYMVVANKMDSEEALVHLKEFKRRTREKPIAISAVLGEGLDDLKRALQARFKE